LRSAAKPDAGVVGVKIVLDVVFSYACGDLAPAALASVFSFDLITKGLFG
jgi:hypothetical protein